MEERRTQIREGCRRLRDQEGILIGQLLEELPLDGKIKSTINKASILRLSSAYIKSRYFEAVTGCSLDGCSGPALFASVLDGFQLVLDSTKTILHVSAQVQDILGYQRYEILGDSFMEVLHPDDRKTFIKKVKSYANEFILNKPDRPSFLDCTLRMKFKILKKTHKTKQTGYLPMQTRGIVKKVSGLKFCDWVMVLSCYPVCSVPQIELKHYEIGFCFKLDKDIKPLYIPENINDYFGHDILAFLNEPAYRQYGWGPKIHGKYFDICSGVLEERGSVESSSCTVSILGDKYTWLDRYFLVTDSKGEHLYTLGLFLVLSKDHVCVKNWPPGKLFLEWGLYYGVPGEEELAMEDVTEQLAAVGISSRHGGDDADHEVEDPKDISSPPDGTGDQLSAELMDFLSDPQYSSGTSHSSSKYSSSDTVDALDSMINSSAGNVVLTQSPSGPTCSHAQATVHPVRDTQANYHHSSDEIQLLDTTSDELGKHGEACDSLSWYSLSFDDRLLEANTHPTQSNQSDCSATQLQTDVEYLLSGSPFNSDDPTVSQECNSPVIQGTLNSISSIADNLFASESSSIQSCPQSETTVHLAIDPSGSQEQYVPQVIKGNIVDIAQYGETADSTSYPASFDGLQITHDMIDSDLYIVGSNQSDISPEDPSDQISTEFLDFLMDPEYRGSKSTRMQTSDA